MAAEPRRRGSPEAWRALDQLHERALNFDPRAHDRHTPQHGWHVDDYCQPLPSEPPGDPLPDGPYEVARRLMRDYEFADPHRIRAVFHSDAPLTDRDMLLVGRFWGLRFHLGVRVVSVRDETAHIDGRSVRVWGWSYGTLQGHLERGQMDYELWKWLDTGEVQFRIHAYSQVAHIRNPAVRLGFQVFGRGLQRGFAHEACRRMAHLVAAELRHEPAPTPALDTIDVRSGPVGADQTSR